MTYRLYEPFGVKLWIDAEENETERLKVEGRYEWRKVAYMRSHLQLGMTFADVGAHIGYFTMLAAWMVGEMGRVFAFEPVRENARRLADSRALNNFWHVSLRRVALSNRERASALYAGASSGQWSLLPISRQKTYVSTICLDKLHLPALDMIKIDVEGAECEVLYGASETLMRTRCLLMDLHPDLGCKPGPVDTILRTAGFALYDIRNNFAPIDHISEGLVELLAVRE